MEKKMVVMMSMILLIISANMDGVKADAFDCYDACSTACVNPDTRLMARCDRKCQIKCGPDLEANGHLK
ncbi:hypothetical protein CDL12_23978 [Handroanthus impetiginosus]|uniref:Thionin-like protein n=1 Tax=Handroanthus impetiginosus TaxID=429701 RepID=A0A2G9GDY7_9LAMI|nr:hypothetical protein CDL12_23978 [Handroanthus impetiginosus]